MVARPPLKLRIAPMRLEDLAAVHAIEQASFDSPWPADAYRSELETNRLAQYLVAHAGDEIAAYAGMWLMVDEAHIITFAVHPAWRRQGETAPGTLRKRHAGLLLERFQLLRDGGRREMEGGVPPPRARVAFG